MHWRERVAAAAMQVAPDEPLEGPLGVTMAFTMPRPRSHYRTGRHSGDLKPSAPNWHTGRPDTTKLVRAAEDALTGVWWRDDALIAWQRASKRYGPRPGVHLTVRRLLEI
jgi:crossover junction endodeoxyribonuclease RusA